MSLSLCLATFISLRFNFCFLDSFDLERKDKEMEIIKICNQNGNKELLKKVAKLYCEIWKEPPWNEHFWKQDEVLKDIQEQLKKEEAILIAAANKNEVIGFTWGYCVDKKGINALSSNNLLEHLFDSARLVFYIDEIGVEQKHRKSGIGGKITKDIISQTSKKGINCWCLRTHIEAKPAHRLYGHLGFKDLKIKDGKYPDRTYWMLEIAV